MATASPGLTHVQGPGVRVGVDGLIDQPQLPAGLQHPHGDLPVVHQHRTEGPGRHTGGTPCRRSVKSRFLPVAKAKRRASSARRSSGSTTASTDQVRGQADQLDVLAVLALQPLDLGRPLRLGEGGQLVVVDGVDGRLRPHHGDRRGRQGQGGVGLEPGPGHGVQPGPVRLAHDHADLGHGRLADGGDQLGAVADDALALDLGPDREPGHVGQEHQRQVEGVAQPDEAGHLVGRVDEQHPALDRRLVGDDPDGPTLDPAQAIDDLGGELALDLEEALLVDHGRDQRVDVERLRLVGRDQGHRPRVGRPP